MNSKYPYRERINQGVEFQLLCPTCRTETTGWLRPRQVSLKLLTNGFHCRDHHPIVIKALSESTNGAGI